MICLVLLMVLLMFVMAGDWGLVALVIWEVGRGRGGGGGGGGGSDQGGCWESQGGGGVYCSSSSILDLGMAIMGGWL